MNTQPSTKNKATDSYSNDVANRLRDFRMKIIDKVQLNAAEKLSITRGHLSSLESGRKRPSLELIERLIKDYNLSTEWLATGLGNKQTSGPAKPTASSGLQQAHTDLLVMQKSMKMIDAKVNQLYDIIEMQQKQINELTIQINNK